MRRAYVFLLRPTARQHIALAACVESHRELYNAALLERREGWAHSKTRIHYGEQSAQLTEIRLERPDQAVWSFSSQQATLRRLNKAFAGFFRRVKAGSRTSQAIRGSRARLGSTVWSGPRTATAPAGCPSAKRVYLQGIGQVKVHLHREVQGRVKTIQIKRQGRRWMLVLSCDDVPANPLPATGRQAGIDVGIASFATTSDGEHVDNPRWGRAAGGRVDRSAAAAATRQARFEEPRTAGGRPWPPGIARSPTSARTSTTNKPERSSGRYDLLVVEDLQIANMLRRAKPVPDPDNPGQFLPNGARAKSGLNTKYQ